MGLSFKPDIDDLRESPAKYITSKVLQRSADTDILIVEPNVHEHPVFKLTDYKSAYTRADIVAFLVSHKEFKTLPHNEEKVILDFAGCLRNYRIKSMSHNTNKRIAQNTLFLYFRTLVILLASLYTSRVVLNVLGIDDYGIYNVVGGIVLMFQFLNVGMIDVSQRFLTYELGKNDGQQLQKVFPHLLSFT